MSVTFVCMRRPRGLRDVKCHSSTRYTEISRNPAFLLGESQVNYGDIPPFPLLIAGEGYRFLPTFEE